jgi:hypothetical protein
VSGPGPAQRLLFVAGAAVAEVRDLPRAARALVDAAAEERFGLSLTTYAVDPGGHVPTA